MQNSLISHVNMNFHWVLRLHFTQTLNNSQPTSWLSWLRCLSSLEHPKAIVCEILISINCALQNRRENRHNFTKSYIIRKLCIITKKQRLVVFAKMTYCLLSYDKRLSTLGQKHPDMVGLSKRYLLNSFLKNPLQWKLRGFF